MSALSYAHFITENEFRFPCKTKCLSQTRRHVFPILHYEICHSSTKLGQMQKLLELLVAIAAGINNPSGKFKRPSVASLTSFENR